MFFELWSLRPLLAMGQAWVSPPLGWLALMLPDPGLDVPATGREYGGRSSWFKVETQRRWPDLFGRMPGASAYARRQK